MMERKRRVGAVWRGLSGQSEVKVAEALRETSFVFLCFCFLARRVSLKL